MAVTAHPNQRFEAKGPDPLRFRQTYDHVYTHKQTRARQERGTSGNYSWIGSTRSRTIAIPPTSIMNASTA